jgi:phospholipid transport system substrate-binding protein
MIIAFRRRSCPSAIALLLVIAAAALATGATASPQDPPQLIRGIGNSIISLLKGRNADYAARKERFSATYRASFDNAGIVFAVAGAAYRRASPDQRRQLLEAFEDYIITVYAAQLGRHYAGEKLLVLRSDVDGDATVVVSLLVPHDARAQGIEIAWRLVNVGGSLRIRDVVIDKSSVVLSLRREFASQSRQQNGDVDDLIAALRLKTSEAEPERAGWQPPPRPVGAGRWRLHPSGQDNPCLSFERSRGPGAARPHRWKSPPLSNQRQDDLRSGAGLSTLYRAPSCS